MTDLLERHVRAALDGDSAALHELVVALKDDLYRLSLRMLGSPSDAQDATQEILIKVVTHLKGYRAESSVRTWAWKIATRHLLRSRRKQCYQTTDFASLEALIDAGATATPPTFDEREVHELAEEVRLGCTQAMLSALKPAQRMVYVLADIFALESEVAAAVLSIDPATFRKRLQRARFELAGFMERKCGLANPAAACRCVRQIPIALDRRIIGRHRLKLAGQAREAISLPVRDAWEDLTSIDRAARVFQARRNELAPAAIVSELRELISSGTFRLFEH